MSVICFLLVSGEARGEQDASDQAYYARHPDDIVTRFFELDVQLRDAFAKPIKETICTNGRRRKPAGEHGANGI